MRTLEVTGDWETIFAGSAREALEEVILPTFLQAQRWFGAKARRLTAVRLADWAKLPSSVCRAFLALFEVAFDDGGTDLYFVPLGVTSGPRRSEALAAVRGPGGEAMLHDALVDDGVCAELLDAVGTSKAFSAQTGLIRAFPTTAFADLRGSPQAPWAVSYLPSTSSNSLVQYNRRLLLKVFRRLDVGVNPDLEIGRFLTDKTAFDRISRVGGAVEYHRPGSAPSTLAIVQAFIPNQSDGWHHALDELARYLARVAQRLPTPARIGRSLPELAATEEPPDVQDLVGPFLRDAALLGRRTGELHVALAGDGPDPAFAPEAVTAGDLLALEARLQAQGELALASVRERLDRLPPNIVPGAQRFLKQGPQVLGRKCSIPPGSLKIRCHGDYHLAQTLWADGDFFIIDFEGEPRRAIEERQTKQSPLKDVAGMLRSFDYAVHAALVGFAAPERLATRLQAWAAFWQRWTSAAFLAAYLGAGGASLVPRGPGELSSLLDLFMLEKACYELVYEINNRPDWVSIPLSGILSLVD
jgi:maltose alpha-D-glucosyltransferase/alpha-amylase